MVVGSRTPLGRINGQRNSPRGMSAEYGRPAASFAYTSSKLAPDLTI